MNLILICNVLCVTDLENELAGIFNYADLLVHTLNLDEIEPLHKILF